MHFHHAEVAHGADEGAGVAGVGEGVALFVGSLAWMCRGRWGFEMYPEHPLESRDGCDHETLEQQAQAALATREAAV